MRATLASTDALVASIETGREGGAASPDGGGASGGGAGGAWERFAAWPAVHAARGVAAKVGGGGGEARKATAVAAHLDTQEID